MAQSMRIGGIVNELRLVANQCFGRCEISAETEGKPTTCNNGMTYNSTVWRAEILLKAWNRGSETRYQLKKFFARKK